MKLLNYSKFKATNRNSYEHHTDWKWLYIGLLDIMDCLKSGPGINCVVVRFFRVRINANAWLSRCCIKITELRSQRN